jgi:FimV-like protein
MQTSNHLHPFLLSMTEKFKVGMTYLNLHPVLYFLFIAVVLLVIGIIVFSAPKASLATSGPTPYSTKITTIASSKDISAIAGDNVIATQLDLAKAYIEMDQKNLAKRILNEALKLGNAAQKNEAQLLIETL